MHRYRQTHMTCHAHALANTHMRLHPAANAVVGAAEDVVTAPVHLVADAAKAVGWKGGADALNSAASTVKTGIHDATSVVGQGLTSAGDLVTGHVKEAGKAIRNAGKALKDSVQDVVKAPTAVAGSVAGAVGLNSVKKGLDTVGDDMSKVVGKAADAAGEVAQAGAAIAQGKVKEAGNYMKAAANDAAKTAEQASSLAMHTAGAAAGAVGLKSVEKQANKLADDTEKLVKHGMDVLGKSSMAAVDSVQ